jgi:peptidoglycan/LPS O-acetylase OafA/YrhL
VGQGRGIAADRRLRFRRFAVLVVLWSGRPMSEATTQPDCARTVPISVPAAPSHKADTWRYLPELDGLRTIAVLGVFSFHLNRRFLPGGFVGVDIFFVISGFLISSVLLQDIDGHRFSVIQFYQRRVARITPALFLILIGSLLAGAVFFSAQDLSSLGSSAAAAAVSAINLKLMLQDGYFQPSQDAQPLLHCWSLAVEEQFYLLFPPFLFLLTKFIRRPIALALLLCAASFALCVAVTEVRPVVAFYVLPTRAWELLTGCALALFRRGGGALNPRPASTLGWTGLVLIGISFVTVSETYGFPGWVAAVPVVGSAMVVGAVGSVGGTFSRILAHPAAVYVGKRSYSLYLWHWPVFAFVDYAVVEASPALRLFLKITISLLGALATYTALEIPARRYLSRPGNRIISFAVFAAFTGAILGLGAYAHTYNYLNAGPGSIASGGISINPTGRRSVVVVGDSQGAMYGAELASIARQRGFRLNLLSEAGWSELPGEPDTIWPKVQAYLVGHHADVVIVAEAWTRKLGGNPAALRQGISALEPYATRIIIFTQPPLPPPTANRQGIRTGARPPFWETSSDRSRRQRSADAISRIVGGKVQALSVADAFLNPDGSIRLIGDDGRLVFEDTYHLSNTGTALVHGRLEAAIVAALD